MAVVFSCASEYKKNLVNHSLLFLCQDKHKQTYCLEVTFDISNFQHLTGFKTEKIVSNEDPQNGEDGKKAVKSMSAAHFFELCIGKRLTESDFEFATDGTTPLKMKILPSAVKKNLSANMVGDYNGHQPKLYTERIAGSVKGCVGFVKDRDAGRYVPNTLLEGDIRKKVTRPDRILVTYRKKHDEDRYSEIVYAAKKIEWDKMKLPVEYSYLPLPLSEVSAVVEPILDEPIIEESTTEKTSEIMVEIDISGEMKKAKETAINLHNMEMSIEFIAKAVNVSVDIVEKWIESGS